MLPMWCGMVLSRALLPSKSPLFPVSCSPAMSSACAPPSSSSAECSFFGGLNASHWEEMDVFRDNFLSLAPHDASSDTCGRSIGDTVLGMQKQQDDSGPVPSEFFAEGAYDGLFAPPANGTEAVLTLTKKQRIGSSDRYGTPPRICCSSSITFLAALVALTTPARASGAGEPSCPSTSTTYL